jgi:anhydro-N-acetylmuramic acid kinase
MSGTSADGVDAVVCEIAGSGPGLALRVLGRAHTPYDPEVRRRVFELFDPAGAAVESVAVMNYVLGEVMARAALAAIEAAGIRTRDVAMIASHGQTIYHAPDPHAVGPVSTRATLQIGEPAVIAARTGLTVVADFRAADVAAGGQGAPLVPYADWALFSRRGPSFAPINIGGIANVTYVPAGAAVDHVLGFDTGPGNMVIDAAAEIVSGGRLHMDEDGRMAERGRPPEEFVASTMRHPFFETAPPRTTGRETFGRPFAEKFVAEARSHGLSGDDVIAAAAELTVRSIREALARYVEPAGPVDEVVVSGGGARNAYIMRRLAELFDPVPVVSIERYGIGAQEKEAAAFAILASDAAAGLPTNVPRATGAARRVRMGKFVYP